MKGSNDERNYNSNGLFNYDFEIGDSKEASRRKSRDSYDINKKAKNKSNIYNVSSANSRKKQTKLKNNKTQLSNKNNLLNKSKSVTSNNKRIRKNTDRTINNNEDFYNELERINNLDMSTKIKIRDVYEDENKKQIILNKVKKLIKK